MDSEWLDLQSIWGWRVLTHYSKHATLGHRTDSRTIYSKPFLLLCGRVSSEPRARAQVGLPDGLGHPVLAAGAHERGGTLEGEAVADGDDDWLELAGGGRCRAQHRAPHGAGVADEHPVRADRGALGVGHRAQTLARQAVDVVQALAHAHRWYAAQHAQVAGEPCANRQNAESGGGHLFANDWRGYHRSSGSVRAHGPRVAADTAGSGHQDFANDLCKRLLRARRCALSAPPYSEHSALSRELS
eukprot:6202811-Pleurochrysis_carterae.AAC.4